MVCEKKVCRVDRRAEMREENARTGEERKGRKKARKGGTHEKKEKINRNRENI